MKRKKKGTLERYKARRVEKGFTQKFCLDYAEAFSPRHDAYNIRCLLAHATIFQWPFHQLDINNVFLHKTVDEEVYMDMLEGVPNPYNKVYKLVKSIYGLK